jgi:zinc protease
MIRALLTLSLTFAFAMPLQAGDVDIQEVTSPGGIKAWLVEERSIPFTALEITIMGGHTLDPSDKRGAINLMTGLIEEGAGDLDAQAFAAARDALAASYSFDSTRDEFSVSARFLTENRDEAIALLREALINPRFDQSAIDRVREQVLTGIRSDALDPNEVAGRTFSELAFDDAHPYGHDTEGTAESVSALTRDDIVKAHRDALVKDRLYVGAAGDISAEELGALLDSLLGDLPESGPPLPGEAEVQLTGGVTLVDFATPQSVAVFGHSGIDRDDPDFFPAFVANQIFGSFGRQSRLSEEVREKRGLTYGVGSYIANFQNADLILGQFASANDRIAEAIEVIRQEWARVAENGVTAQELEEAKTYMTGSYPLRFDGNARIAGILVAMQVQGLGPEYINERNDRVNAVTLEDIDRVVKRIYRPDDLRFVVVGQPEGLESVN